MPPILPPARRSAPRRGIVPSPAGNFAGIPIGPQPQKAGHPDYPDLLSALAGVVYHGAKRAVAWDAAIEHQRNQHMHRTLVAAYGTPEQKIQLGLMAGPPAPRR